jgi:hypothetical protein
VSNLIASIPSRCLRCPRSGGPAQATRLRAHRVAGAGMSHRRPDFGSCRSRSSRRESRANPAKCRGPRYVITGSYRPSRETAPTGAISPLSRLRRHRADPRDHRHLRDHARGLKPFRSPVRSSTRAQPPIVQRRSGDRMGAQPRRLRRTHLLARWICYDADHRQGFDR